MVLPYIIVSVLIGGSDIDDLPRSPTDYIHRIGRAGQLGTAISFICYENFWHFTLIEKRAQIKLKREQIEGFELTGKRPRRVKGKAPVKGKHKNKKDKTREAGLTTLVTLL